MANLDDCRLDKSKLNLDLLIRAGLDVFIVAVYALKRSLCEYRRRPFLLKHVPLTFKHNKGKNRIGHRPFRPKITLATTYTMSDMLTCVQVFIRNACRSHHYVCSSVGITSRLLLEQTSEKEHCVYSPGYR